MYMYSLFLGACYVCMCVFNVCTNYYFYSNNTYFCNFLPISYIIPN